MPKRKAKRDKKVRLLIEKAKQKETVKIYPMMPRGYNALERAELRKFERELMNGKFPTE